MIEEIKIKEKSSEGLENYYKMILICKICGRKYGSDFKEEINLCPICEEKLRGYKSRLVQK
jgi:rubrerythrin